MTPSSLRYVLPWTLGALLVADAALTAWFLRTLGPSPLSHPDAPRVLLSLGGNAPCLVLVVVLVTKTPLLL